MEATARFYKSPEEVAEQRELLIKHDLSDSTYLYTDEQGNHWKCNDVPIKFCFDEDQRKIVIEQVGGEIDSSNAAQANLN